MDIDLHRIFGAVSREVSARQQEGREARIVRLRRAFDTDIQDLWDALTNQERIPRWFLPVTGDLRLNGRYQLEGNAGGTITACEPPRSFDATWEYGGGISWIAVTLEEADSNRTLLTLEHIAYEDNHWQEFGPGAAGVGWDLGLIGLDLHLTGDAAVDPAQVEAWSIGEDGKAFIRLSSNDWARAAVAAGTLQEEAEAAAARTTAFYTGENPDGEPEG